MKKEKQMKEQKEIVDKIKTSNDFFGFQQEVLVPFLDYENAKEFLKPEVKKVAWKKSQVKLNKETVLEQMKDYMEFAWEKCSGHRGLSASRSLEKMRAWPVKCFHLGDAKPRRSCPPFAPVGYLVLEFDVLHD